MLETLELDIQVDRFKYLKWIQIVTVLYELLEEDTKAVDIDNDLVYQSTELKEAAPGELATLKIRYKIPKEEQSKLIRTAITKGGRTGNNFAFSAAVAQFGMLLSHSEYSGKQFSFKNDSFSTGESTFDKILQQAQSSLGKDPFGYRTEFVQLVKKAKELSASKSKELNFERFWID